MGLLHRRGHLLPVTHHYHAGWCLTAPLRAPPAPSQPAPPPPQTNCRRQPPVAGRRSPGLHGAAAFCCPAPLVADSPTTARGVELVVFGTSELTSPGVKKKIRYWPSWQHQRQLTHPRTTSPCISSFVSRSRSRQSGKRRRSEYSSVTCLWHKASRGRRVCSSQ